MWIVKWTVIVVVLLAVVALAAGQFGLLQGSPPTDLGVRDGKLKAPSDAPNSVSSQAALYPTHPQRAYAEVAPLALQGSGAQTMARLRTAVESTPGARVVKADEGYLYAQFTTRWMKYVDDLELWFDPAAGVVQARSASRLGHSDMGANRARVEALRRQLANR
jgi:uncharacterized protein (DUF1499 family)